jgi:hypothetical protein
MRIVRLLFRQKKTQLKYNREKSNLKNTSLQKICQFIPAHLVQLTIQVKNKNTIKPYQIKIQGKIPASFQSTQIASTTF